MISFFFAFFLKKTDSKKLVGAEIARHLWEEQDRWDPTGARCAKGGSPPASLKSEHSRAETTNPY